MSEPHKTPPRRRPAKSTFTTKSGNTIKLNQSLTDRMRARRDAKARRRAAHLSTLPKNRWKRLAYRLKPSNVFHYWFSRDGAIMALKLFGIGVVLCFVLLVGVFAYFRKDLPPIKDLSGSKFGGTISYYDRTGQVLLWQDYKDVKRVQVNGNDISPYMKHATIAIEDKNFYKEGAFSVSGILRAALHDVFGSGGGLQGGSTITQQLVKLSEGWTNDHTIARKFKEIVLAVDLERQYSKDDILNGYLNIAPYGGEEYGVEAASEDYFGVSAKNLTLAQAAMLASIPQDPPYYSPYSSPQFNSAISDNMFGQTALLTRQHYVLDQMAKQGYITKAEADVAKGVDILAQVKSLQSKFTNIKAPYFVEAAKQQLDNTYGAAIVNRGGWQVTTTLNVSLQNLAEKLVADNLPNVKSNNGDEEAMVAEDVPTGQMLALVGGVDFNDPDHGQINYAETKIPPGSSFKPYDYVSLINNSTNVGAGSVLYDSPQPIPGYPCTDTTKPLVDNPADPGGKNKCLWDYDFIYPGAESIRYALAGSRNMPAEKAMLSVVPPAKVTMKLDDYIPSIDKTISTADAMMNAPNAYQCYSDTSLTRTTQCYNSSAIGDGAYLHLDQHVNGLATLSRLGTAIPTTYILKIVDSSQKTIYQWTQPKGTQVVRPDAAYIIDSILSDPDASYLSKPKKFQSYKGWEFAVKTGTTNNNFDGLMTSFSTKYAVVSWVGNHTRTVALKDHHMEDMTEPLTAKFMEQATDMLNQKPSNWQEPSDIKKLPAYIQRTHVGDGSVESGNPNNQGTDLFPSWYVAPKGGSGSQTVDVVSGGLATSCTPPLARQTQGGANDNTFSADIFMNASASSGGGATSNDTVHNCSDTSPSITVTEGTCDVAGKCDFIVAITQGTWPLSGGTYNVSAPAGTISILVNGQAAQTVSIPSGTPSPYTTDIAGVSAAAGSSVQAQVVDSVLYSGSSNTLTVTGSSQ